MKGIPGTLACALGTIHSTLLRERAVHPEDIDLFGIRFHFSDGSAQGPFGAYTRGEAHQTAEFPLHHITAIGVGQGMQELRCGFTPLPDYYERLAAG
ncbi:MAG: hypothetical protein E6Q50_08650 [Lysobacter sp.]|nr:MAG: hypothetical protein E6Q50_08650 [Lysobacter sp.]